VTPLRPHQRLKAARKRAKLRQIDVADQTGINRSRYTNLENGRLAISAETAAKIAAVVPGVRAHEIETPREISRAEIAAFRKDAARLLAWADDLRSRL
jgi:transcriptional regulator with XRE-family HTH domain